MVFYFLTAPSVALRLKRSSENCRSRDGQNRTQTANWESRSCSRRPRRRSRRCMLPGFGCSHPNSYCRGSPAVRGLGCKAARRRARGAWGMASQARASRSARLSRSWSHRRASGKTDACGRCGGPQMPAHSFPSQNLRVAGISCMHAKRFFLASKGFFEGTITKIVA